MSLEWPTGKRVFNISLISRTRTETQGLEQPWWPACSNCTSKYARDLGNKGWFFFSYLNFFFLILYLKYTQIPVLQILQTFHSFSDFMDRTLLLFLESRNSKYIAYVYPRKLNTWNFKYDDSVKINNCDSCWPNLNTQGSPNLIAEHSEFYSHMSWVG